MVRPVIGLVRQIVTYLPLLSIDSERRIEEFHNDDLKRS
jgi:hypothetical protein